MTKTDYFQLPDDAWVIASDQHSWHYRDAIPGLSMFSEQLHEPGDWKRTGQLLDAVMSAAMARKTAASLTREQTPAAPTITLQWHIHSLASSYQTTHATPPTMRSLAKRAAGLGNQRLAAHCKKVAREESGHDQLALCDLAALGIDAEAFVAHYRPARSVALVHYFQQLSSGPNPVAVLGYAYALERRALLNTTKMMHTIEGVIPDGVKANRCLRVHSSLGPEVDHVDDSLKFIAASSAAERKLIANALYETIVMMNDSDYPGEMYIDEQVRRFTTT